MNVKRKQKAVKIYSDFAAKELTHDEIMKKLKSDLDNKYTREECEEIEASVTDQGLRVMPGKAEEDKGKKLGVAGKPLTLAGGNEHFEEWLARVTWSGEAPNRRVTVVKHEMLRSRVIITPGTADTLNHGHMSPACVRPILYLRPGQSVPDGYEDIAI